jgi:acetyl-CoA synthetase
MEEAKIEWFKGAKLNITKNCLDRHLNLRGDKTAIIWEPNNPDEEAQHISYKELHERVCKMANVLTELGIKKGDRVCIYLPMIPELAVTMLACAKMGAVHSVIFAGFSASAVATRVNDCEAKMIITSDGSYRGNKAIDLKGIIDEAVEKCPTVEKVLVVKRTNTDIKMKEGRDFLLDDYYPKASTDFVTKIMDAEDPLFIFILLVLQVNQKECFILQLVIWFTQLILSKMYLIIEKMISIGVLQILVGLLVTLIFYTDLF